MDHFVYIIYSDEFDLYYKGYSLNPDQRLIQHNNQESRYTAGKGLWRLVYKKAFLTKREALAEERRIKRLNRTAILKLIAG